MVALWWRGKLLKSEARRGEKRSRVRFSGGTFFFFFWEPFLMKRLPMNRNL